MDRRGKLLAGTAVLAMVALAACSAGPSVSGTFERTFNVSGPVRIELSNAAGDVNIEGSADSKVHVRADVRAYGFGFGSPQQRLDEIVSNPPLEQRGDTIRIGKDLTRMRNVSISYQVQVPHDTEIDSSVVSGSETVRSVRGPVKTTAVSGSIRVEHVGREAQLTTVSGSVDASDIGDDVHANSASGSVNVSNTKSDVRVHAISGVLRVSKPGGRVDAGTTSGVIDVDGASNDVKASAVSGRVTVQGNPGTNSYWDVHTTSGGVQLLVPPNLNFHLSAEAVAGEIRADIPIVIEEQTKHSLRARVGNGGARIQVRTVSGQIQISPAH